MQQRDKEIESIKKSLRDLVDRNIPHSPNGHLGVAGGKFERMRRKRKY